MSETSRSGSDLPVILAGPILRRASAERLVLWLVTSRPLRPGLALYPGDSGSANDTEPVAVEPSPHSDSLRVGQQAFVHCLDVALGEGTPYAALPEGRPIGYDILLFGDDDQTICHDTSTELAYPGEQRPRFVIHGHITHMLHGSCRRPHHDSADG